MHHLKSWRRYVSAALEWSSVDKGLILLAVIIPIFIQYFLWSLYVLNRADRETLINVNMAWSFVKIEIFLVIISLVIIVTGLYLRKKLPNLIFFQHIALQFFSLSLVLMSYSIGTASFCAGLVLLGAPVFGFILLDRKAVWWATGNALAALLALSYATAYDWLPYAPVMIPPSNHTSTLFWMNSFFFFAAPFFILIIIMADQLLVWWREREERIRVISRTDALTGIHNRMSILDFLNHEMVRAARLNEPLTIALLDLDHFKKVNDNWGHPTGDRVLKDAAKVFRQNIRNCDVLGRYGGEEFIIILPGADSEEGQKVIERCRTKLAETDILTDSESLIQVTASFGMVSVHGQWVESHQLIQIADRALYQAKHNGRNRIEVASL
ncbi:GGDEF domain-containing protein [Aquirhabdus sp.]|uniref:GGDEF domain-containing protein n=1 Tax=Aquirhabdus sp. TaxID=2824160 RepID=UPI00396C6300